MRCEAERRSVVGGEKYSNMERPRGGVALFDAPIRLDTTTVVVARGVATDRPLTAGRRSRRASVTSESAECNAPGMSKHSATGRLASISPLAT
uniref:Uncharacterized protein n=1 Tax=Plectus sambesii TaxID=2011161 RepID=A0A914WIG9_9BILA